MEHCTIGVLGRGSVLMLTRSVAMLPSSRSASLSLPSLEQEPFAPSSIENRVKPMLL